MSEETDMKVFVDMDGVLTDFVKAVYPFIGELNYQFYNESPEWDAIVAGAAPDFWSHMPWTPDGMELWQHVQPTKPYILSAPSQRMPHSGPDKIIWCTRELGISADRVILAEHSDKCKYAVNEDGTPNILIDDSERNINQWREAGGIGIHHKVSDPKRLENTLASFYAISH